MPSFKQQNLPAWQPILTAGTVLPTLFLIGVAFVPIGIGLLMSSVTVQEISIDYTDCKSISNGKPCSNNIPTRYDTEEDCSCKEHIELKEDFRGEIYIYYGLSNFYQNHRRYVKSRDDVQLLGNPETVNDECAPFDKAEDPKDNNKKKPIAPCGAIANSLFNDTFQLTADNFVNKNIIIHRKGIAWSSDKRIRFQNPPVDDPRDLNKSFLGTMNPPNWRKPVYALDTTDPQNNGFQYEPLIVWMRTAALPTFRKLYGILIEETLKQGLDHLPRGKYTLHIGYNYPVTKFNGRKRFIMSNTSWLGGKNNFLGIAYIVVGCICFLISALFLYVHKKYGRLPSEITRINQTTPYLAN